MSVFDVLSDIIFPPVCLFCGKTLGFGHRPLVCENCRFSLEVSPSGFNGKCCRCGSDFVYRDGLPYCDTCRSCRHPFNGVISAYYYTEGIRRAIIEHKFNFEYNNAEILAGKISELISSCFTNSVPDYIIPVPSSRKRLWERGYDSLLEIAEEVSDLTDIPLLTKLLLKHKHIPQQSALSGKARVGNVRGCFSVTDKTKLKNKTVILLDDVYTTGATTRECAKVLKRAGCSYIMIATVAISETFKRSVHID